MPWERNRERFTQYRMLCEACHGPLVPGETHCLECLLADRVKFVEDATNVERLACGRA